MCKASRVFLGLVLLGASVEAMAYTPYKKALELKTNNYIEDGLFLGGRASTGATLLGVRRAFSAKSKLERVIFDLGDRDAHPAGTKPSYFQASLDSHQKRIVVDLAQLRLSEVSELKLKEIFKNSPYISSAEFTLDPEDKSGTVLLNLRRPVRLEVFQILKDKKPARLVLDIAPTTVGTSKR